MAILLKLPILSCSPRPATCQRRLRGEGGQAVAETVLSLPIILLLMLAVIGVGHLIFANMIVVLSANQSARLASVQFANPRVSEQEAYRQVEDTALSILSRSLNGNGRSVRIEVSRPTREVAVEVTYSYTMFVPWLSKMFFDGKETLPVTHRAIYRLEG